ncbi:Tigger transposable element-derived protein 6 [Dictyocoela muelleri]|nr:Tigger transposable element-derived protein 6 [Dictyocoela muelleri]
MIARKIAMKLDLLPFEASNEWIENFKKRHVLSFENISGESKSANFLEVESFRTEFKEKINEYGQQNIFNCDETALYFKNPPRKSFVSYTDDCKGKKSNKMRVTCMLTCSMV